MKIIDFRSDTITRPSDAMRKCMASADVGDDFYGDDPTTKRLEERAAETLGKEAALFVISGTMGNLVSIRAQVSPGKAAVVGETSHMHLNETGHLASVCGLTSHPVKTTGGCFNVDELKARWPASQPGTRPSVLNPVLGLIAVENTHNRDGGRCVDLEHIRAVGEFARARSLTFHMDGARLFNASVSLRVPSAALVEDVDSVSFCLSKGLAAPGGAVIVGAKDFIDEARHWRQMVGGGMRQSGVLAAAGLMALGQNIERLQDDHDNAQRLATGLSETGLVIDINAVETNIVLAFVPDCYGDPKRFYQELRDVGVLVLPPNRNRIRFVTHADVSRADVDEALRRVSTLTSHHRREPNEVQLV